MDDKKIKELWQQIEEYSLAQNWDGVIKTCGQLLELDPERSEIYYTGRGFVYANKGDDDNAIADYTKAIEHKLDYADAYNNRGTIYVNKGDDDLAIADFTKAIECKSGFAIAYSNRGTIYANKGDDDLAIADFTKAIEHKPNDADAYYNRGLAYARKKDYGLAIDDFTKAIEYNPNDADAYFRRGIFYAMQGNYDCAVEDLSNYYELGRKDEVIAYIAHEIKKTNPENSGALLNAFIPVWFSVSEITKELHLKPNSEDFPVVHYCSLRTLKSMIKGNGFRFYNATHMDDPKEGEAFFNMMDDKDKGKGKGKGIRDYFYKDNSSKHKYPSSCYIGSFVANENKDEHIFWQIYGKDKDIGAAGCNLTFNKERFSSELGVKTAGMISNEEEVKTAGMISNEEKLPTLFSVCYQVGKDEKMKKMLGKLKNELEELKNKIEKYPEHKEELKSLACELIDSVRYLFKSSHYASEKEVRVIKFRAPEGDFIETKIKTDDSGTGSPKFYIDPYARERFCFNEVTFGAKINDIEAWRFWLDKKLRGVKVEESKISYR